MILTVTLNPAVDRTVWVDGLHPGELHRVRRSQCDVGGKGINVSRALVKWSCDTAVVAVLAGETGRSIRRMLEAEGLEGAFVVVEGESRTNVKVIEEPTGRMTELNEAGPNLDPSRLDDVTAAIAGRLGSTRWLVLSGSLPPGSPADSYRRLIEAARALRPGLSVALDTSGTALRLGLAGGDVPSLVKPNRIEMEELLGRPLDDDPNDWKRAAERVRAMGVDRVVLSLGVRGALFAGDPAKGEGCFWARSQPVRVASPTGCGDTLLAATLYALSQGWSWERCARFAVAAATAAAALPGTAFPTREQISHSDRLVTTTEV